MRRLFPGLGLLTVLAGCGAEPVWAPDEAVARAAYVHDGPPSVTLYTVIGTRSGAGAHSALMVNASQRVIFDPAGTWHHPRLPERNDVHFGMTPKMVAFYIDYHARETYDVVEQTVPVTPAVAELVMERAKAHGAVPKAHCALSVADVLEGVPGFDTVPRSWYPLKLMDAFAAMPGVEQRRITDDDDDDNHGVLIVQAQDPITE
jgi:hypothetical protein